MKLPALLLAPATVFAQAVVTGPSSSSSPYLLPSAPGVTITSIITAGDVVNGQAMCGTPDGLGILDNNNGTFTLFANHEFSAGSGMVRAHGSDGAFITKLVISKSTFSVLQMSDLIQEAHLWSGSGYTSYNASNPSPLAAFNRFCSGDLPSQLAFYNPATGLGTTNRIFMNGEEGGTEGRAFAHVVTGPQQGHSYELPALGKANLENAVARPVASDQTVVMLQDDAMPGQVYMFVGNKQSTGNDVEKAGLTNGTLYGINLTGYPAELSNMPTTEIPFTAVSLGDVRFITGAMLNNSSNAAGVTTFLRPEDGAWDPMDPANYYFATTNAYGAPSRLWRLHFTGDPVQGGVARCVLNGSEGHQMLDNICIDGSGFVMAQEDVGNNPHLGRIWQFNAHSSTFVQVARHDPDRFVSSGSKFLTEDEESSGIIDAQQVLGPGMFIFTSQAHYGISSPVVEGGQLLALYAPEPALMAGVSENAAARDVIFQECSGASLRILLSAPGKSVVLSDLLGNKVAETTPAAMETSLSVTGVSPGVYVITVTADDAASRSQKIILR